MYAEVLVEYSAKAIDKTFTYLIPHSLENKIKRGMKVLVPFGNKIINGFVTGIKEVWNESYQLKEINSLVDEYLCLNEELMSLGNLLEEKTLCTKITAYQTMLPSSLKVKKQETHYAKYISYIELVEGIDIDEFKRTKPQAKTQIEIIEKLKEGKQLKNSFSKSAVDSLLQRKIIKIIGEQVYRLHTPKKVKEDPPLTSEQQSACDKVKLNEHRTYLLYGVTGSGKTEVYIRLIKKVVQEGKTAILLVPEISLTTQIVNRFYDRFGLDVAIFHSALSEGEKYDEYLKILRKEVHIVIGTRSAIFTPLENLGIIIMDEEHSENYKQDSNPRYHAIDMAEYRAKYHQIPLLLGSATPSLESMARAKKGVYELIEMPSRIGDSKLPKIEIVDMAEEMKKRNTIFSTQLKEKINERLVKKEQVILLLNRRGYSSVISCKSCGYTFECPNCDITLTYHKAANNLRCHYCGYVIKMQEECPSCKEKALGSHGLGTEKLELELNKIFKEARVIRMDADTTTKKGAHEKIINAFKNHEYDILLGTQMIAKGLDFPFVTLVGIINADATLNIPDFKSGERTFALLAQVAGRAGRSSLEGEVVIQTFNPDNYTLNCVKENNYDKFYQYEMNNRHKLDYPPYYFITSIKIASKEYELASKEIVKVKQYIEKNVSKSTIILGPTTASFFKLNNIYRFQILLKYKKEPNLMKTLKELDSFYIMNKIVNIEIDNNPMQI